MSLSAQSPSSEQRWLGLRGVPWALCPGVQWQRPLAWVLFAIEVLGGGAADHAAPVLTALPLLAAAVLLLYYGREPVLGHGWSLLCQVATS